MARYLWIIADQRPFPIGADSQDRAMYSVNFHALATHPVDKFEEEVARVLFDASLGVVNTTIFFGPVADIPKGNGTYISIIDTGGTTPEETHDGSLYESLSFQLVVRSTDRKAARTRALACWRALHGLRNTTVTAA